MRSFRYLLVQCAFNYLLFWNVQKYFKEPTLLKKQTANWTLIEKEWSPQGLCSLTFSFYCCYVSKYELGGGMKAGDNFLLSAFLICYFESHIIRILNSSCNQLLYGLHLISVFQNRTGIWLGFKLIQTFMKKNKVSYTYSQLSVKSHFKCLGYFVS